MTGVDRTFTFAYQPIVDIVDRSVFAYEALIRGPTGESAGSVLDRYMGDAFYELDHAARQCAPALAMTLGLQTSLSLNFSPATLAHNPSTISATVDAAQRAGLPLDRLILEVTEGAVVNDPMQFAEQLSVFRPYGIRLAIDDFGAGYAGLNLLAEFQPDIVKIDMGLVRNIDSNGPRQAIARAVIQVCAELGLEVIAEGVETAEELNWFASRDVRLYQGFLFGMPGFEQINEPKLPEKSRREVSRETIAAEGPRVIRASR